LELFETTRREWFLNNNRDLGVHGRDKECLSETSRPDFISTMSPDVSQTNGMERVIILLLLRDTILGGKSITRSYVGLWLRVHNPPYN
jgi:hypothetical protein